MAGTELRAQRSVLRAPWCPVSGEKPTASCGEAHGRSSVDGRTGRDEPALRALSSSIADAGSHAVNLVAAPPRRRA